MSDGPEEMSMTVMSLSRRDLARLLGASAALLPLLHGGRALARPVNALAVRSSQSAAPS